MRAGIPTLTFPLESGQDGITPHPGLLQVTGAQGAPDALLGVVGVMQGVVAPPGAIVVPEMVVWVATIDSQAGCDCCHLWMR